MSLQFQLSSVEAAAALVVQVLLVNIPCWLMRCLRAAQVHAKGGPAVARYKVFFLFNKLAFSNYVYIIWLMAGRYVCCICNFCNFLLMPPLWLLAWAEWSVQILRILATVVPQVVLDLHLVSVAVTLLDGIYNRPNHHWNMETQIYNWDAQYSNSISLAIIMTNTACFLLFIQCDLV